MHICSIYYLLHKSYITHAWYTGVPIHIHIWGVKLLIRRLTYKSTMDFFVLCYWIWGKNLIIVGIYLFHLYYFYFFYNFIFYLFIIYNLCFFLLLRCCGCFATQIKNLYSLLFNLSSILFLKWSQYNIFYRLLFFILLVIIIYRYQCLPLTLRFCCSLFL